MAKNSKPLGFAYVLLDQHTDTIRDLIAAGHSKGDILSAYVEARYPEVVAGTLLKVKGKARTLATPEDVAEAKSLLRKHGNTHLKLAASEQNPALVADRMEKVAASVANARKVVKAREDKARKLGVAI